MNALGFFATLILGSTGLGTSDLGAIVRHDGVLAIAQVVDAVSTPTGMQHRVEIISSSSPLLEGATSIQVAGPAPHTLKVGESYLAALARPGDVWLYRSYGGRPISIARGQLRPAAAFVRQWVAAHNVPSPQTIDRWFVLLQQPFALGQELSQEALIQHADHAGPRLNIEQLGEPLRAQAVSGENRRQRMRLLGSLAPRRTAAWLTANFDVLHANAKMAGLPLLTRFPSPEAVDRLHRCAGESKAPLKLRCARALSRIVESKRNAVGPGSLN
ncbi:MAG: hypothetical protein VX834_00815 [Myxococcota bacterium]|nr:hypothetical protein [Myxococcota bacterium]